MLLFNEERVPIDLGYSVSNEKWFSFVDFVSKLCISVMFTFCLFSICVNIYLLFSPVFDGSFCIITTDRFLLHFLLYLLCRSKFLKR